MSADRPDFSPFGLEALSIAPPPSPLTPRGSLPRSLAEARRRLAAAEKERGEIVAEIVMLLDFLQRYGEPTDAVETDDTGGEAVLETPTAAPSATLVDTPTGGEGREP